MIEILGPLVSALKLILDGLSKAKSFSTDRRRKSVFRELIIIQVHLVDLIDNGCELLAILDMQDLPKLIVNRDLVVQLSRAVDKQISCINGLMGRLMDPDVEAVLATFEPETRRNLYYLIPYGKGGVLLELARFLRFMLQAIDNASSGQNNVPNLHEMDLAAWDHDEFIKDGGKFINQLYCEEARPIGDYLRRDRSQDRVLEELERCSECLATFLKERVDMKEVLKTARK
jgi:hypothetical protein